MQFKDSSDGGTWHNDTQLEKRQNSVIYNSKGEKATATLGDRVTASGECRR